MSIGLLMIVCETVEGVRFKGVFIEGEDSEGVGREFRERVAKLVDVQLLAR